MILNTQIEQRKFAYEYVKEFNRIVKHIWIRAIQSIRYKNTKLLLNEINSHILYI